jgi:competence protein ComFC
VCSRPFSGAIDGDFTCPNCEGRKFHFDCVFAAYRAQGVVRSIIHRFKYDRQYFLRHLLAGWLIEGIESRRISEEPFDALVPVPLHPVRQRNREFNQAEVLSILASKHCGKPMLRCLRRVRNTETQTHFDRNERMENLRNAFELRKTCVVQGMRLLLIDDVLTTGATLDECSRVLRDAGAVSLRAVVVARG